MKKLLIYTFCLFGIFRLNAQENQIKVTVFDESTGQPIKDARVIIYTGQFGDEGLTTTSGIYATQKSNLIKHGQTYSVDVHCVGYKIINKRGVVGRDARERAFDVYLEKTFVPFIIVSGRIFTIENNVQKYLPGVEVKFAGMSKSKILESDEHGGFVLAIEEQEIINRDNNRVVLSLFKEGFENKELTIPINNYNQTDYISTQLLKEISIEDKNKSLNKDLKKLEEEKKRLNALLKRKNVENLWKNEQIRKAENSYTRKVIVENLHNETVFIAFHYMDLNGKWVTEGWWDYQPYEVSNPDIYTSNRYVYYFATTKDKKIIWDGEGEKGATNQLISGETFVRLSKDDNLDYLLNVETVSFQRIDMKNKDGYKLTLTYN